MRIIKSTAPIAVRGLSIPDELARREERLKKLAEARAKIEARAKERYERELAGHRARLRAGGETEGLRQKPGGKAPAPPVQDPLPTDQINLTDEESRIMPVSGGGFDGVEPLITLGREAHHQSLRERFAGPHCEEIVGRQPKLANGWWPSGPASLTRSSKAPLRKKPSVAIS